MAGIEPARSSSRTRRPATGLHPDEEESRVAAGLLLYREEHTCAPRRSRKSVVIERCPENLDMADPRGIEPPTPRLEGGCSSG